jgi:hypothetical protein
MEQAIGGRMIPRTALNEFLENYCCGNSQLVAVAEAAFPWFNKSLSPANVVQAPDTRPKLSAKQQQLFDFMKRYQTENGSFPTHAEMIEHLGASSFYTAQCHLAAMQRKGYIERRPGKARGYKIKDAP